ncbi:nucleotidyl transferase AbiEii/AbiGii toxin family protein [bacterium]|nr:nucleotidyl transferase AbiEii/AbiGii toxin family protein [bacterium]
MVNNSLLLKNIKEKSVLMKTSPENVLREELQKCVLFLLSEMDFFQEGVFQGGTALRIMYGNVRYSEDLDFTFQSKDSTLFLQLEAKVNAIPIKLHKWFPYLPIQKGKWQKQSQTLKRYQFTSTAEEINANLMLQLEFANIPAYQPIVSTLTWNMVTFPLKTKSESEIIIDKIVAFGLRPYLKGRDLWDLYFLLHEKKIQLQPQEILLMIKQKLIDYGYSLSDYQAKFLENVSVLTREGDLILDHEMKRFMDNRLYSVYHPEFPKVIQLLSEDLRHIMDLLNHEH